MVRDTNDRECERAEATTAMMKDNLEVLRDDIARDQTTSDLLSEQIKTIDTQLAELEDQMAIYQRQLPKDVVRNIFRKDKYRSLAETIVASKPQNISKAAIRLKAVDDNTAAMKDALDTSAQQVADNEGKLFEAHDSITDEAKQVISDKQQEYEDAMKNDTQNFQML